jgi:putative photosynthetic complex assembly protein
MKQLINTAWTRLCQPHKTMNHAFLRPQNHSLQNNYQKRFAPIGKHHFQMMLIAMIAALLYVTYVTQFSTPTQEQAVAVVKATNLVFKDDANGDILIEVLPTDSTNSAAKAVKVLRFSGEQGFLRGTLRALARDRRIRGLSPAAPFVLALDQSGRLSITDSLTNKGIDLIAFGSDNLAVFEQILINATEGNDATALTPNQTDFSKEMK